MNSVNFVLAYRVEDYITFAVSINSDCFSGKSNFCLPISAIYQATESLCLITQALSGEYTIFDYDSDDFFQIIFKKYGHLSISGQLGGSYNNNYLVYCFETDQTMLYEIIESLKRLAEA